ncbi:RNA-binding protein [Vibrio scophthalmi]|uniref:Serine/arginine-rich splicing factor n=2 Tax=Vibrio scophthalmi TaxID=45658 RepID=A0A1B1NPW1_9VIBR|nr:MULTISPECIES: RNA-binding protein [Vibrio]ANS85554.1 Serine/arginine-rich splicing factor [Vibrio scophthalmi]ANU36535.1 Serine/arginine-rich splicing factor [Vibrio scophthalmi]EGU30684.1 putative RNA-binding protein [Vibrio scophthalmi LMG 19158]EGU34589.1 putative RNA-binding protein [Vibrio sp. N418]MCY9803495.1 RNA-binding protein [Vibrio scophthalmi]
MKLLVRNLARATTEQDIRKLFAQFGEVRECTLVLDQVSGQSKGFAFVEMPNDEEANEALEKLNLKEVAKSKIRVKAAQN